MSKIRPKECQDVEFKRIWKDEYLKWICGFANAQGAVMYFGVDDDREVYGLKDSKRLLEDIPNKVVNNRMVWTTLRWSLSRAMLPSAIRGSITTAVAAPCKN